MTLTLDLAPDVLARLEAEAAREGVPAADFAVKIIEQQLSNAAAPQSLHDLFAQWNAEDATDDPEEIAARQREWEELKEAMNASHSSPRKLFP